MRLWFFLFATPQRKTLTLFFCAALLQGGFFFLLPVVKYFQEKTLKAPPLPRPFRSVVTKINLKPVPQKNRKIKQRRQQTKTPSATLSKKRYQLELNATGATGLAMESTIADQSLTYEAGEVEQLPVRLSGRAPEVPAVFLELNREGRVELEVEIDAKGAVREVLVATENPPGYQLAEAARTAVWTWKFRPALVKNLPVSSRVLIPFVF